MKRRLPESIRVALGLLYIAFHGEVVTIEDLRLRERHIKLTNRSSFAEPSPWDMVTLREGLHYNQDTGPKDRHNASWRGWKIHMANPSSLKNGLR